MVLTSVAIIFLSRYLGKNILRKEGWLLAHQGRVFDPDQFKNLKWLRRINYIERLAMANHAVD